MLPLRQQNKCFHETSQLVNWGKITVNSLSPAVFGQGSKLTVLGESKVALKEVHFLSPCCHSVLITKPILAQEPNWLFSVSKAEKPPLTVAVCLLRVMIRWATDSVTFGGAVEQQAADRCWKVPVEWWDSLSSWQSSLWLWLRSVLWRRDQVDRVG